MIDPLNIAEHKPSTKLLGVHIDETLTWDNQIKHISSKVSNGLQMLYLARKLTDNQATLKTIYYSLVQPYFDYCDVVWGDCSKTRAEKLQKLQNRAAQIITRADYSIRSSDAGLKITAGQRTMSGLIVDLTGQTLVWPVILTGHLWIRTFYNIFHKLSLNAFCSVYNAIVTSFFFGFFFRCFALKALKKKRTPQ